jgi:multicomponent Na+:H+ antiporter subunit B
MLFGIYSLLMASIFMTLDAVDVAFTEAAVGAGISTVLMITTLALTARREKRPGHTALLPLIVVTMTGAALVYGTFDMPDFGDPNAPIHQHVVPRYIDVSDEEIGIPNMVTSVLASYRGYDTLGEVTVIFTAGISVLALIGGGMTRKGTQSLRDDRYFTLRHHLVLHVVAKLLIPLILLFALYVQFHGDYGPGGGFQAGVIFAAGFILYALVFGLKDTLTVLPQRILIYLAAAGVLLYAGVGVAALLAGGNFLDYSALSADAVHGQHIGILLIEFGVGLTVAAVMMLIFFNFVERGA